MEFRRAIELLTEARVDFVIIGGVSASLHGSAYVTSDLDICYSRERSNLSRLVTVLAPFHPRPRGFPPGLPFKWEEATLYNASVLTLETDIGDFDLLAEVAGLGTFEDVKAASIEMNAHGNQVRTLNLRSLIQAKRAAGRPKDLLVLPELESLLEASES